MKIKRVLSLTITAALLSLGCGSKVSIEEGKAKIEELAARGVPDREMSTLKMYIVHMEGAKRIGNSSTFKIYQDSLTTALGEFEGKMNVLLESAGPFIDSVKKVNDEKTATLKGLHLKEAEKGAKIVDSIMNTNQKLMARARIESFSLDLDTLIQQQKTADSLRNQFVGIWVMEQESADRRFKLVERTEIHMRPDGSLYIMEGKKGDTSEDSREDWVFQSTGTWDLMGDVAHHYITNEKRVKQDFSFRDASGKWTKKSEKPYDSTITNGSKDRYAAWESLNKDYKRFPIKR
ncbi:MAG: hypothetical protein LBI42_07440 [Chitinispirillales bacterium]|jgi:hypothetical protein|nr:hypothetical protein [Chitinispirillales bacterium]